MSKSVKRIYKPYDPIAYTKKFKLARAIRDVSPTLSFPKCRKIVNIIAAVMREGLLRDGIVTVAGLGSWKIVTHKAKTRRVFLHNNMFVKGGWLHHSPEKKVVKFKFSKAGREFVYYGN